MATARWPDPTVGSHDHDHGHDHDHDHDHDHGHGHGRPPASEPVLPPSREGSVVMDIGGDVGALVLYTAEALDGAEIDLFAVDGDGAVADRPFVHSAVRARHLTSGTRFAAVYPGVPAGEWVVAAHAAAPATRVRVDGGRVTEVGPIG